MLDPSFFDNLIGTDAERIPLPFSSVQVEGWMDSLAFTPECLLVRTTYRLRRDTCGQRILLGEVAVEMPRPTLMFQTVRGGSVIQRPAASARELIYRPGQDCFRRIEQLDANLWVETGDRINMTGLIVSEAWLVDWLGELLAERLVRQLGLVSAQARVCPMPRSVSAPLEAAMSSQHSGPLRRLFAQARLLDYLGALVAHLGLTEPTAPTRQSARDSARALHDHLIGLEGKLPSLDRLAAEFDLSARRLNAAFVLEYGLPIHRFITEQRLVEAHQAILTSHIPLKQLAARLGYTHVNHFNSAFRRKFGYPPGSLRREPRETGDNVRADEGARLGLGDEDGIS